MFECSFMFLHDLLTDQSKKLKIQIIDESIIFEICYPPSFKPPIRNQKRKP